MQLTPAQPTFKHILVGDKSTPNSVDEYTQYLADQSTSKYNPIRKGNYISISLDDDISTERVVQLKSSLIGRLIQPKKLSPYSLHYLEIPLSSIWNTIKIDPYRQGIFKYLIF